MEAGYGAWYFESGGNKKVFDGALSNTDRIGDIVLSFGRASDNPPCRSSVGGWFGSARDQRMEVLISNTSTGWVGYRIRYISDEEAELVVVGADLPTFDAPVCVDEWVRSLEHRVPHLTICWNRRDRRLHVWTDRLGTIHAYYANNGKCAAIGTFFPAVADIASDKKIDWEAITGFMAFGFFPQDRTFYKDVYILRPASHYEFDEFGRLVRHERYWEWYHEPYVNRSFQDTVTEFADCFHEVVRDLVRDGRVAVPISGGLDSRSTVAALEPELVRSGRLWFYSYGYTHQSIEISIARKIAQTRNLPFDAFTVVPYLFDKLDVVLAAVEGFQDLTQCRQAVVVDELSEHADYVIGAHYGDLWLGDMGLASLDCNEISEELVLHHALRKVLKRGREWLIDNLCKPNLGESDSNCILRQFTVDELIRLAHVADPDFRIKVFKTDNWCFRWTLASIRMFRAGAIPRLPFCDPRLIDFFCTVPTEFVVGRRLQVEYLKRYAPDLARITWQPYDANLYSYHRFNTWHIPKRALKKAWRILTRKPVIQRNWELQFLNDRGRGGLHDWLLRSGLKLHDLVSRESVKELLDAFYGDPSDPGKGYTVSMLLTFSAWLERYG